MKQVKEQFRVVVLTAFAAFGGLMFGYDIGVINGVKDMNGFRRRMNLSLADPNSSCTGANEQENVILGLIVSVFSLGCFVGALASGDRLGRKLAIIIGGVVFFLGGAVQAGSFYIWMVIIGRVTAGGGVGVLSMVVPVYNAELSPAKLRGTLVSLTQLLITFGIMVSFLMSLAVEGFEEGWRIALGMQCVLATILILGMLLLPETPRWLVKRDKSEKAYKVLRKLRSGASEEEVKDELVEIKESLVSNNNLSLKNVLRELLKWKVIQRIAIGMMLQMFQQLTGMNVIMYYSTSIFCSIRVSGNAATAIVGTINFLTTLLTVFLVDKVGRKVLLLVGALGMMLSIVVAAMVLQTTAVDKEDSIGYVVVILVCAFVFNFSFSWGPVAWVVTSEIFPLSIRGLAVSLTTSSNWIGNFIIAMVTPILLGSFLGTGGTFFILGGLLFASFLFVLLTLPETKGESLEKIEQLFDKPWLQRVNLVYYIRCGCPWTCCSKRSASHSYSLSGGKVDKAYATLANDESDDQTELLHNEEDHMDHEEFTEPEENSRQTTH